MNGRLVRHLVIALFILGTAWWSLSAAQRAEARGPDQGPAQGPAYGNPQFAATAVWLEEHMDDVIVVDVRTDEYFDGTVIPGAIRMPWSLFRMDDKERNLASTFVGVGRAEALLGEHGISRQSRVVLYDSVKRDGGATASYVFWVLDVLGHPDKRVLDGGIDAWKAADGALAKEPATLPPVEYAAPADELRRDLLIHGEFVEARLDDPHYQILDVRSAAEYRGEKGTRGMQGEPLKLGHIPTAGNIEYTQAWQDEDTKLLKSQAQLEELYAGLDPSKTIIVYCNSGRRSSFSYYVLRLMGLPRVITYEPSWKEWGQPGKFFPVETRENPLPSGPALQLDGDQAAREPARPMPTPRPAPRAPSEEPAGGYVSCGG